MKAYASLCPTFFSDSGLLTYGIELTGSSGTNLLDGKYFTTLWDREGRTDEMYYSKVVYPKLDKVYLSMVEGIIPEMNRVKSYHNFIELLNLKQPYIFGNKIVKDKGDDLYILFTNVFHCLNDDFVSGFTKLRKLEENYYYDRIKDCLDNLLSNDSTEPLDQNKFISNYEKLCNSYRKEFKLI